MFPFGIGVSLMRRGFACTGTFVKLVLNSVQLEMVIGGGSEETDVPEHLPVSGGRNFRKS